ncbi:DNA-directed RNA polymerase subunit beta' [Agathobacter rectalis]|jgi:DNA-directed RNA polymerase subunit beta'|uniref:DNA-directed RNA polymerase subunit beta' n=1 Tax=Agathobacter rectalis TaxID=39491 RepID=A0A413DGN1_9FIRM|nr:DNA-directed RNA polymerase subunit beta' [Agathobacter rectalis]MDB8015515.1 DNA-directed RNA polymerase subunit beta' [Agathobacter rectalis]MDB8018370.1 DNA-directed RNA polymerase subunit beta' [Agathobacter rectalis]MDB8021807.1 DNA-directed RNA polymerase subunit beta' [Agathobacter rectalis]MDB8029521.1 DNA-directed RNA polymerase subunit beta' [Agathobacter rectalis]RGW85079.1 DNA-directed RNA polymerase subunit beta' [Agathobacter rectalis]
MPETNNIENNQAMQFDAIQIGLASPEKIREWSHGEVKKPETINYRTLKPEKDGLFCEKIFGPTKDWECHCGKYKKIRYKGVVCDRCGVEITKSSVRRERMGHIELAAPVSHIWYFKGIPSRMGLILDLSPRVLERVLYFASYIVLDPGETKLAYKQILNESEYQEACDTYGRSAFRVGMGAESIHELLAAIDLEKDSAELKAELENATGQKRARIIKRLEVVEAFRESGNKPEWMIMTVIPVIPPDLRPMVQLDGGRFATSDLNDLYRRIINRNNRLRRLLDLGAPDIIVRNEKRMLQEAVDALIDNGRRGRPVTGPGNRALKSLSDMLKGKGGRFRQNLLGKRVDYSGRSVICVEPKLKIYQCGLPKEMAIELFKPFVMKELAANGTAHNIKSAKKMVERLQPEVWDVLEDVIKEHPVMLNRAPTLHRLGIQAFEPILVEGKAIKLHPLVCTAFNADFDGDQMAVHLPLTAEAQAECRFMLLSPNNLLKPSDGGLVAVPSQDMILGVYYLTMRKLADYKDDPKMVAQVSSDTVYNDVDELRKLTTPDENTGKAELGLYDLIWFEDVTDGNRRVLCRPIDLLGRYYGSVNLAMLAYENKEITLHQNIFVHRTVKLADGTEVSGFTETTVGLLIFNENIPQDLGFIDRSKAENALKFEVEFHVGKKQIKQILEKVINTHGATTTAEVLDNVKAMGYKYSTQAAMTVSISDMTVPPQKPQMIADAQDTVDKITRQYKRGLITDEERYKEVIETWKDTDDALTKALLTGLDKYNNIFMMADSGARGSDKQIKQLAGMRGLMADTTGRTIELPIKSCFREGLDVLEYFMSAHGARKGLSDTALRTADSGYLTRRLVDVSQHMIVRETDCCAGTGREIPGMVVKAFMEGREEIESLQERITGRFSCNTICDKDGNVIVKANHMITPKRAAKVMAEGVDENGNPITQVKIRTVLTCRSHMGVCAKCYGSNLATGQAVQVGEAIGIIAAQSIGEPGTQLTMRTFHTGGVAGGDITQGLPRVEEIFEARKPKGLAIITEFGGIATIKDTKKKREVIVTNNETGETKAYLIPYGSRIKVVDGQELEAGDELTEGSVNPHDILKIKGVRAVQDYMLREVQRVYRLQGVEINDKHVEVIVRQCLQKIRVEEPGDSDLLPGSMVDALDFLELNEKLEEEGKELAVGSQVLLGITKASLATNSFLSAASFQETTKVLTEAAIKGKVDPLIGMKENVIIGKLIPAGTGMKIYRNIKLDSDVNDDDTLDFDDDDFADFAEEEAVGVIDTDAESVDEE